MVDLETMDEMRDIARERVRQYRQRISKMCVNGSLWKANSFLKQPIT